MLIRNVCLMRQGSLDIYGYKEVMKQVPHFAIISASQATAERFDSQSMLLE